MSFILDALKKSETDRQRQSGPSLFEVKVAAPRRRLPIWAVAIAVLLGINLIVVSWMLLRHPSSQQPAATSAASAPGAVSGGGHAPDRGAASAGAPDSATPSGSAATGPTSGAPRQARESAASPSLSAASPTAPPASASATVPHTAESPASSADAPPAGAPGASPPTAGGDPSDYAPAVEPAGAPAPGATEGVTGGLPLYQQIVDSAGLPSLHLDLHVFADRPRDRFVMINMHRLGEGDSLPEGVRVETIRPDGVVLTYRGTRFLLPRN